MLTTPLPSPYPAGVAVSHMAGPQVIVVSCVATQASAATATLVSLANGLTMAALVASGELHLSAVCSLLYILIEFAIYVQINVEKFN